MEVVGDWRLPVLYKLKDMSNNETGKIYNFEGDDACVHLEKRTLLFQTFN